MINGNGNVRNWVEWEIKDRNEKLAQKNCAKSTLKWTNLKNKNSLHL